MVAVPDDSESLALDLRFPGGDNQVFTVSGFVPDATYIVVESEDRDSPPTLWRIDDVR